MVKRLSTVFVRPAIPVPGQILSEAEVDHFKTNGFVVKPGLIDPKQVRQVLDRVWDFTTTCSSAKEEGAPYLDRQDIRSWRNPRWIKQPPPDQTGPYQGRERVAVHGRTIKMHILGNQRYLRDLVKSNDDIQHIAQHLLAEDLKPVHRTRGVYAVFPRPLSEDGEESKEEPSPDMLGPHTDRVCQQLNVCIYLDDVPARNGGFTLYPGSHQVMFNAHQFESNWSPTDKFQASLKEVVDSITPVEIAGEAGDVIFWHGRCVHSAGIHVGDRIRWAVFGDFMRDAELLTPDEHKECGQFEWYKDTPLARHDQEISGHMWRNWRLEASK